jgi:hypothetical protein
MMCSTILASNMVGEDRRWMYEGWRMNDPSVDWIRKTEDFIDRAFAISRTGTDVRCPCSMCWICRCQDKRTLSGHLCKYGYILTMKSGCITARTFLWYIVAVTFGILWLSFLYIVIYVAVILIYVAVNVVNNEN